MANPVISILPPNEDEGGEGTISHQLGLPSHDLTEAATSHSNIALESAVSNPGSTPCVYRLIDQYLDIDRQTLNVMRHSTDEERRLKKEAKDDLESTKSLFEGLGELIRVARSTEGAYPTIKEVIESGLIPAEQLDALGNTLERSIDEATIEFILRTVFRHQLGAYANLHSYCNKTRQLISQIRAKKYI